MTDNIQSGNRAIAEFMGYKFDANKKDGAPFYRETNKDGWVGKSYCNPEYHKNWNSLMPVVEKIAKYEYKDEDGETDTAYPRTFGMLSSEGNFMVRINRFECFEDKDLIVATWQAVVRFIEWYNEFNNTQSEKQ